MRIEVLKRAGEQGLCRSGGVAVASGKMQWTRRLYETTLDANEKGDLQAIFLTKLRCDIKPAAQPTRRRRPRVRQLIA